MFQFNLSFFLIIFYVFIINFIYDLLKKDSNLYKNNINAIRYIYISSTLIILFLILCQYFRIIYILTSIPLLGNIISIAIYICIFLNLYYLQVLLEDTMNRTKFKSITTFSQNIIKYYTNLSYIYLIGLSILTYYMIL